MADPRIEEADWATGVYHAALARIGAAAAAGALRLWGTMPTSYSPASVQTWRQQAATVLENSAIVAYRLAVVYYQLLRALATNTVVQVDRWPAETTTLGAVRDRFEARTRQSPTLDARAESQLRIALERIEGIEAATEASRAAMWFQVDRILAGLHIDHARDALDGIDTDRPASEVDADREDLHAAIGRAQAATVARLAMNAGRGQTWGMMLRDNKALGYARVSSTGSPCGFCAMLMARGATYKSARSAWSNSSDGNKFHDYCRCVVVPIFAPEAYQTDRFALNREFERLWPRVTKGHAGASARRVWAEYIQANYRAPAEQSDTAPFPAAPAAVPTASVQEAQ
jgi:hypothetical protein